jgi:hypothetical protein
MPKKDPAGWMATMAGREASMSFSSSRTIIITIVG